MGSRDVEGSHDPASLASMNATYTHLIDASVCIGQEEAALIGSWGKCSLQRVGDVEDLALDALQHLKEFGRNSSTRVERHADGATEAKPEVNVGASCVFNFELTECWSRPELTKLFIIQ